MSHCLVSRLALAAAFVSLGILASCQTTPTAEGKAAATRPGKKVKGKDGKEITVYPFNDPKLPLDERIKDVLSRLTVEEKAAQMQMNAPAIERLNIPAYHWWNEALHGVARNGEATVFPQAIGMAATWNTSTHFAMAKVIALEARAKHEEAVRNNIRAIYTGLDMWSPNINIFRDPRWVRQETYGEDPYLTGRFGVAFCKGLQGEDPHYFETIATPKHYAVHSGPEPERHRFNAKPSDIDLWTTYLPAFEACVREGKAYSVMAAYNRTDDLPCTASPRFLTDILRKQWGFEGYVTSDVDSVADVWTNHQFAATPEEAAAASVKAGCDLNGGTTYKDLTGAVRRGLLTEKDLDISLGRLFAARFRMGLFDPPELVPYTRVAFTMNDNPASDKLALDAARQSMVLLKNAGVLPLDPAKIKNVAVIGPTADSLNALVGNYNGTPSRPVTFVQGIKNALGPLARVSYNEGCPILTEQLPLEDVVPAQCLFTDNTKSTPGLTADYYRDVALGGRSLRTRIDPTIDFMWYNQLSRDPLPSNESMSVRWSGILIPPDSGIYQLGINAAGGFRLWVDGKQIVDEWDSGNRRTTGQQVKLTKDTPVPVTIEYYRPWAERRVENAGIQLRWTRPTHDGKPSMGGGVPLFANALRAAQSADATILVLGITAEQEREEHSMHYEGFADGDRTSLDLPRVQQQLLEEIAAAAGGKPVILVLTSGSALSVNWANDHVPAILQAWYPGQRGGDAAADILFGRYNPAGRLPVTFYKSVDDLPAFTDYNMQGKDGRTYRYFSKQPLYPFGHGLSYSKFEYSNFQVIAPASAGSDLVATVKVKNISNRDGDEVAQCYIDRTPGPGVPSKTLVGFARVLLKAGEEKEVKFTVTPLQLSLPDEKGVRQIRAGAISVRIGPNSVQGESRAGNLTQSASNPEFRYVPAEVSSK